MLRTSDNTLLPSSALRCLATQPMPAIGPTAVLGHGPPGQRPCRRVSSSELRGDTVAVTWAICRSSRPLSGSSAACCCLLEEAPVKASRRLHVFFFTGLYVMASFTSTPSGRLATIMPPQ